MDFKTRREECVAEVLQRLSERLGAPMTSVRFPYDFLGGGKVPKGFEDVFLRRSLGASIMSRVRVL
ncbi:norsolorinic acid reductase [Colletotrichum tofieldiae]|nr:norsolorinic acid reductase [Colletotrichum tofieldiae]